MTKCRSQGRVPAPIICGFIDGGIFAYLDNHPAANTKVPGDLEANVARNISDRLAPVAAVQARPNEGRDQLAGLLAVFDLSHGHLASAGLDSLNGVGKPRNFLLRVRLKTSSRIAELSQHEADGGEFQEGKTAAVDSPWRDGGSG